MNNIEIKVGQVYIEDRGAGRDANRLEIFRVDYSIIEYRRRDGGVPIIMVRNRFEGLVRSGVFVLLEIDPARVEISQSQAQALQAENEKLRASNKRLTDQLKNLAVRNLDLYLPINVR